MVPGEIYRACISDWRLIHISCAQISLISSTTIDRLLYKTHYLVWWFRASGRHAGSYLTKCIYLLVLESKLPPKTVNLVFGLVIVNNKLTILWGS